MKEFVINHYDHIIWCSLFVSSELLGRFSRKYSSVSEVALALISRRKRKEIKSHVSGVVERKVDHTVDNVKDSMKDGSKKVINKAVTRLEKIKDKIEH